mgnify:CR=1 FL=1
MNFTQPGMTSTLPPTSRPLVSARATYFYTYYLFDNAFVYLRMGYASAMAWVQLLIVLALTALAFWSGKRWVHYQAK